MHQGYFYLGRPLLGLPLRVHWSAVFLIFLLSGPANPHPLRWFAVVFLILVHEYGHAVVARWAGAFPLSIHIHGFGGMCHWDGYVTQIGRACIASGGVWAQGIVFVGALIVGAIFEPPDRSPLGQILIVFVVSNALMAALNLVPIPPLDGAEAWKLPWLLAKRAWARQAGPRHSVTGLLLGPWKRLRMRWKTRKWNRPKGPTLH